MKHILDINDWNKYIYNKKLILISNINKNNTIDVSEDSLKFNAILKDIIKINIFNISYIAFMTFKFLETSFIPSPILLNGINIYSDEQMYIKLYFNEDENYMKNVRCEECNKNVRSKEYVCNICNNNNNNNIVKKIDETYTYITALKFIINMILDFVVTIELLLNIQCLLITDFIDKIYENNYNKNNNTNNTNENNTNENNTNNTNENNINAFKPKIFKIFNNTNKATIINIKPSTRILLILKLISKLSANNYTNYNNNDIIQFISDNSNIDNDKVIVVDVDSCNSKVNPKISNYMKNKKDINDKSKSYLDTFIMEISKYFGSNNNDKHTDIYNETANSNSKIKINLKLETHATQDIYLICSNYMLNNIELIFNNFENIFSILEEQLYKSANINEKKIKTLFILKNVIKNIIDIEIDNIKKLFYI